MIVLLAIVAGVAIWMVWANRPKASLVQTMKLADGALLLDVRTSEEYQEKHGENALNIPLAAIGQGVMPQVAKDAPIYVYCRSGNRSAEASELLRKAGFKNVTDIGAYENLARYGINNAKMVAPNRGQLKAP